MKNFEINKMFSFQNNLAAFRIGEKQIIFKILNVVFALVPKLWKEETDAFRMQVLGLPLGLGLNQEPKFNSINPNCLSQARYTHF